MSNMILKEVVYQVEKDYWLSGRAILCCFLSWLIAIDQQESYASPPKLLKQIFPEPGWMLKAITLLFDVLFNPSDTAFGYEKDIPVFIRFGRV